MPRRKLRLVIIQGGRKATDPASSGLPREALRVIQGGPSADVQQAIERTLAEARRMRREIEERIARSLDDQP
jgi:hypothetical protein